MSRQRSPNAMSWDLLIDGILAGSLGRIDKPLLLESLKHESLQSGVPLWLHEGISYLSNFGTMPGFTICWPLGP